jgi:hypothetical protein
LNLFENLNRELAFKDQALVNGEAQLSEKDRELTRLKNQLRTMDENMKRLIEVTKISTEATEASKIRHIEEMDKIKRK